MPSQLELAPQINLEVIWIEKTQQEQMMLLPKIAFYESIPRQREHVFFQ